MIKSAKIRARARSKIYRLLFGYDSNMGRISSQCEVLYLNYRLILLCIPFIDTADDVSLGYFSFLAQPLTGFT
jgi:hypothetical protein